MSLFAVELAAAHAAWRGGGPPAPLPGGRLATALAGGETAPAALFDADVEDRAVVRLYDAPFAALAAALDGIARATRWRGLDIAGLEAARSAYPPGMSAKGGAGLVAWLEAVPEEVATAARGVLAAAPRGVDAELVEIVVELLGTVGGGVVVVGELG